MNIEQLDIMRNLTAGQQTQRTIARHTGYSLGKVNRLVTELQKQDYVDSSLQLTAACKQYLVTHHPQRAIILAAGYGMRMVPINMEEPKGLLEVNGEPLIERLIKQLHAVGIDDIHIVVGFMKEHYEYLIDQYHVKLIVNTHYEDYKNLYSLYLARLFLADSYVAPCDIWFKNNPFSRIEDQSWYLFSNHQTNDSAWRVTNRGTVKRISKGSRGDQMVGIAYLNESSGRLLAKLLQVAVGNELMLSQFWEQVLNDNGRFLLKGRLIADDDFNEINSYEQLRDIDFNSIHLQNKAMRVIEKALDTDLRGIKNIRVLKKGMTNRSFFFEHDGHRYIMRIPGEGTGELINRQEEYDVYQELQGTAWTERVFYLNPRNGYKLSAFIEDAHNARASNWDEVTRCMAMLRKLHHSGFKVGHAFHLYDQIKFYESLRKEPSAYRDYAAVKDRVDRLRPFISQHAKPQVLCHIDANPDNFVFDRNDHLYLIDWEYAGMQDPDIDVAMFAIYAMYDRSQLDKLIDTYYQGQCDRTTRLKIYAYAAACGLLWSNWCEYKQSLGLDFGEYSLAQYRYAKEYSSLVLDALEEDNAQD
ncbi:phosphotransferase [Limosilactobacillus pontis]|uniref:phosphotransferase n=2 Tax=Limosilactobacillus pontis TaxID=35787 RepID=UPI002F2658EE